jgi:hypothetical protein
VASQWAVRSVFDRRAASRRKDLAPAVSAPAAERVEEAPESRAWLDGETVAAARRAAAEEAMSLGDWLARAVYKQARLEGGLRAVAQFEADYGPMSAGNDTLAREILQRFGVGRDTA